MKNFITEFKIKARAKKLTSDDMLSLAIYKALSAKSEEKRKIADILARRAFTPSKSYPHFQGFAYAHHWAKANINHKKFDATERKWNVIPHVLGVPASEFFSSEQLTKYVDLLDKVNVEELIDG